MLNVRNLAQNPENQKKRLPSGYQKMLPFCLGVHERWGVPGIPHDARHLQFGK